MTNGKEKNEKEKIPRWKDIVISIVKTLIIFFLGMFFALTSSDIKNYMGDHNKDIELFKLFAILVLTIIFYVAPKLIFLIYSPKRYKLIYFYISGIVLTFIVLTMIHHLLFSILSQSTINYPNLSNFDYASILKFSLPKSELESLWIVSFWWLFSILLINIMLTPLLEIVISILEKPAGRLRKSLIEKRNSKDIDEVSS
jgi:hypothetical protein